MNISVIIPVYKKTDMFLAFLQNNLPYLKGCQIIIVNDDPTKSIKDRLPIHPQIQLIENTINLGFAGAVDTGIQQVQGDYVMLLNSDVKLRDTSYTKALTHFANDPKIFAVSFAQIEKNGETVGKNKIFWLNGFLQHSKANDMKTGITGWAEGGSCIIDLKKYREIGGFDRMYSPFYWEDIDLSYRAWKQGYTVMFDSDIIVEHHHESTIKSFFSGFYVTSIAYRNQLLFIWKNIQNSQLISSHKAKIPGMLIKSLLKDPAFVSGYFRALVKKSDIMRSTNQLHSDNEILAQFNQ